MGENPFETAERWEVSTDTMLPVGNHVVTIVEAEGTTSKSGNANPQIVLRFENSQGSIRDWLTYNEKLVGKIASLFVAAETEVPQEGEFDLADKCRLTDGCIRRLLNKKVGLVIREEIDDRPPEPGKGPRPPRKRVQGYVTPGQVTSDTPADTSGLAQMGAAATTDEDIPF